MVLLELFNNLHGYPLRDHMPEFVRVLELQSILSSIYDNSPLS